MTWKRKVTYSLLTGLLLGLSWPPSGFSPFLFIAWVPLWLVAKSYHSSNSNPNFNFNSNSNPNSNSTPNSNSNLSLLGYVYLSLLVWNLSISWWIYFASPGGALAAWIENSLVMTMVFMLAHKLNVSIEKYGKFPWLINANIPFIAVWIGFEYFHHNWDLSYPWLTLGNALAGNIKLIQWYEFTGVLGGSLWILLVNSLFMTIVQAWATKNSQTQTARKLLKPITFLVLLISIPICISFLIYQHQSQIQWSNPINHELKNAYTQGSKTLINRPTQTPPCLTITLVQPNLDPYNEKFNGAFEQQVMQMLNQASSGASNSEPTTISTSPNCSATRDSATRDSATRDSATHDSTTHDSTSPKSTPNCSTSHDSTPHDSTSPQPAEQVWIFPETALTEEIWENELSQSRSLFLIQKYQEQHPNISILTGASTAKVYPIGSKHTETSRKFTNANLFYDNFNTAFYFRADTSLQIYHKSKLVPGVEKMPFPILLKPLDALALNLGGTVGSLATQPERSVFTTKNGVHIAPIICYESIYGEFVTEYVRKGAQVLAIITNDGWWSDTPGYKHHLLYAGLRAIETRRPVVRAANTGISAFINPMGERTQQTTWWKSATLTEIVQPRNELTFYTQHGDYLGKIGLLVTSLILLILGVQKIRKKYFQNQNSYGEI